MRENHDSQELDQELDPMSLYEQMPRIVRASLMNVLRDTRVRFAPNSHIIEDIGSQVLVEVFGGELKDIAAVRIRIRTLCFLEVNYMKRYQTGQDLVSDDGDVKTFEGPKDGVDDLREIEDVSDEGMELNIMGRLVNRYEEEDRVLEETRRQHSYLALQFVAIYKSLESPFLKRFFVEWLVNGRNPRELSRMISVSTDKKEHVGVRRVSQCRGLIVEHAAGIDDMDVAEMEALFGVASFVFKSLADDGETFETLVAGDDQDVNFSQVDVTKVLEAAEKSRQILYVRDFFPELLTSNDAKRRQIEGVTRLESGFETFLADPGQFCIGEPQELFPHQRRKMQKMIKYLVRAIQMDDHIFFADIAPPGAGKTYMQALLAKLMDLPFVFVTSSNSILLGPDGALVTFQKLFHRSDLGLVNAGSKEFGRRGTLTTYASFTRPEIIKEILLQRLGDIPLVFLLDEGDLAQSELRRSVIRAVQHALHHPVFCAFSATTKVSGRYLGDVAEIVDEMGLKELIQRRKAKHILGYYVSSGVTVDRGNVLRRDDETAVDFDSFEDQERELFVATPFQIVSENHLGEKGIIQCMSVRHAELVAERLSENGVNAVCISGKPAAEQRTIVNDYISGDIAVLTSCDYLARGFSDHGVTEFVVFANFTSSSTALYHKVGRGFRSHPEKKVLTVYQMLPGDVSAPNFIPALLSDLLPIDNTVEISSDGNVCDMRSRLMELIRGGEIEFIGAIGEKPTASSGLVYITEIQVQKVIDTLESLQYNSLDITANNFDELFRPMVDAFLEVLDGDISGINTGRNFMKLEVEIGGKKVTGRRLLSNVLYFIGGVESRSVKDYWSVAVDLVRTWYESGERPDVVSVHRRLSSEDVKRSARLTVDDSNVDDLFRPIMDQIVTSSDQGSVDMSWFNWQRARKLPDVQVGNQSTTANAFFHQVLVVLFGMTQQEGSKYKGLGAKLMQDWYRNGERPSHDSIQRVLAMEKSKRKSELKLDAESLDSNFLSIMNAFCEAAGGEIGSVDWITGGKIVPLEVQVGGKSITGLRFLSSVVSILCGVSHAEAQSIQRVAIEIVREWYTGGSRPTTAWCLEKKQQHERKRGNKLNLTKENVDGLFRRVIDAFISKAGKEPGDFAWVGSSTLAGLEVSVDGHNIKGGTFCNQFFCAMTGLPYKQASENRGMIGALMRRWYDTGQKPSEDVIQEMLNAPKRTRFMS